MDVLIPYLDDDPVARALQSPGVRVEVDVLAPGLGELTSFAAHLPLVPGDRLRLDGSTVTGVVEVQSLWMFEVLFNTPAPDLYYEDDIEWAQAELAAIEVVESLTRMVETCRGTTFSVTLATESRRWFDAFVASCPQVASYQVLRQPGDAVDLAAELATVVPMRPLYSREGALIG